MSIKPLTEEERRFHRSQKAAVQRLREEEALCRLDDTFEDFLDNFDVPYELPESEEPDGEQLFADNRMEYVDQLDPEVIK